MLDSIILVSLFLNTLISIILWPRLNNTPARMFFFLIACELLWTVGYLFELHANSIGEAYFWDSFQFPPSIFIATAAILLTRSLVNLPRFEGNGHPIWSVSVPVFVLIITPFDMHLNFLRQDATIGFANGQLQYDYANFLYIMYLWTYGQIVICIYLLIRFMKQVQRYYKLQIALLLLGICLPFLATLPGYFGVRFGGIRDITPIAMALSNVPILFAMWKLKFFNVEAMGQTNVLDQLPVGVVILDEQGRTTEWNKLAHKLLTLGSRNPGFPAEELPVYQLLKRGDETWQMQDKTFRISLKSLDKQGSEQKPKAIVIENISKLLQQQNQLEHANEELKQTLLDLKQAQARIIESERNQIMVKFIQELAHELNTPLGNLKMSSEILRDKYESSEVLDLVEQNLARTIKLMNGLSELTSIEVKHHRELADIVSPVAKLAELIEVRLTKQKVRLSLDHPKQIYMFVDINSLQQTLLKLIDNSLQHAFDGSISEPKINIRMFEQDEFVKIEISDNGVGLPEKTKENLFHPFSSKAKRGAKSAGLGLFVVHRWVRTHLKGQIEYLPEKSGSAFLITLPIK